MTTANTLRLLLITITLNFFFIISSKNLKADETVKPFKRAMYFPGGGPNFTKWLGMYYSSLLEHDGTHKPDLLIGICGGSIAASIIAKFAHLAPRDQVNKVKEFIQSKEMHSFMLSIKAHQDYGKLKNAISTIIDQVNNRSQRKYPNLNSDYVLDFPQDLGQFGQKNFSSNFGNKPKTHGPGIMILTAYSNMALSTLIQDQKKISEFFFTPLFLTDEETKNKINNYKTYKEDILENKLLRLFPYTYVKNKNIEVRSDYTFAEATRASISDPFLMKPFKKTVNNVERFYLTGAYNLTPIEFLQDVAENIFYINDMFLSRVEVLFYKAALNHDYNNKRAYHDYISSKNEYNNNIQKPVNSIYKFNIDFSSFSEDDSAFGVGYDINLSDLILPFFGLEKILEEKIDTGVPKDYEEFKSKILGQFEFGYQKTKKALGSNYYNSKRHFEYFPFKDFTCYPPFAENFKEFICNTQKLND